MFCLPPFSRCIVVREFYASVVMGVSKHFLNDCIFNFVKSTVYQHTGSFVFAFF